MLACRSRAHNRALRREIALPAKSPSWPQPAVIPDRGQGLSSHSKDLRSGAQRQTFRFAGQYPGVEAVHSGDDNLPAARW